MSTEHTLRTSDSELDRRRAMTAFAVAVEDGSVETDIVFGPIDTVIARRP